VDGNEESGDGGLDAPPDWLDEQRDSEDPSMYIRDAAPAGFTVPSDASPDTQSIQSPPDEKAIEQALETARPEGLDDHVTQAVIQGEDGPIALSQEGLSPKIAHVEKKAHNPPRHLLVIRLISSGSVDRDRRRLKQVYGVVTSVPGEDRFAFVCKENGHSVRLEFPNSSTSISDSLIRELNGMVGEGNVILENP
jgi:hypothetical protein